MQERILVKPNNRTKGDTRRLFQATKLLLGDARESTLPECDSDKLLADKFNHFFLDEIVKIRDEISNAPVSCEQYYRKNLPL